MDEDVQRMSSDIKLRRYKCVLDIRIKIGNVNNEIIHFVISFLKENDYFDYEPITIPIKFDKDDEILKEGLEIPKEDLPKLIDKMLSYKEH